MKTCPKCKTSKPEEAFSRQAKSRDGRYPYCKECASERSRRLYASRGGLSWKTESTCVRCRRVLPKTSYRMQETGRRHAKCADCETEVNAQEARGLKECAACRQWLARDLFYPSKVHLPSTACAECTRKQANSYGARRRSYELKKQFGITIEQYKQLLAHQNFRCPICLEAFEPGNHSYPLDHAHSGPMRGRIRAIVHDNCNRFVLWRHDDPLQLRRAADIIEHPLTEWVVPEYTLNQPKRKNCKSDDT